MRVEHSAAAARDSTQPPRLTRVNASQPLTDCQSVWDGDETQPDHKTVVTSGRHEKAGDWSRLNCVRWLLRAARREYAGRCVTSPARDIQQTHTRLQFVCTRVTILVTSDSTWQHPKNTCNSARLRLCCKKLCSKSTLHFHHGANMLCGWEGKDKLKKTKKNMMDYHIWM